MSRKPLIFSLICIFGLTAFGLLTWLNLPELDRYPIHWNGQGEADGFAGRTAVFWTLMIMPISQIFLTALFYFIPKIEPLQQNFEQSRGAYNVIWVAVIAFMTAAGIMIIMMYQPGGGMSIKMPLRWATGGLSLLFIVMGNVFGKVRQNYLLGIRTPWTLSSNLSWEKTHRIGGRLFVVIGAIGLVLTIFKPQLAFPFVIAAMLGAVVVLCVYSYRIWKGDPNKRS